MAYLGVDLAEHLAALDLGFNKQLLALLHVPPRPLVIQLHPFHLHKWTAREMMEDIERIGRACGCLTHQRAHAVDEGLQASVALVSDGCVVVLDGTKADALAVHRPALIVHLEDGDLQEGRR